MSYANGQIPLTDLLPLRTGWNSDGYWEHRLAPGSFRRWKALVEDVENETGVTLRITEGWNAYRPLDAQWTAYRNSAPGNAAYPGTSSHGGRYSGRDTMAIDVANWGQIGQARFYEFARKHGFTPGVFSWEPWHIVDYNPWVVPAGEIEEEDMNADQDARLREIERLVARLTTIIGGSLDSGTNVTSLARAARDHSKTAAENSEWIKSRIGGSTRPTPEGVVPPTLTDMDRQILSELDK